MQRGRFPPQRCPPQGRDISKEGRPTRQSLTLRSPFLGNGEISLIPKHLLSVVSELEERELPLHHLGPLPVGFRDPLGWAGWGFSIGNISLHQMQLQQNQNFGWETCSWPEFFPRNQNDSFPLASLRPMPNRASPSGCSLIGLVVWVPFLSRGLISLEHHVSHNVPLTTHGPNSTKHPGGHNWARELLKH